MMKVCKLFALFCLFFSLLAFFLEQPSFAKQHYVVQKVLDNSLSCAPNFFFSQKEINSRSCFNLFSDKCETLIESKHKVRTNLVKDLNLIPVNFCVLRGNRNFSTESNEELLKKLNVKTILNTDFFSHKINAYETNIKYKYLPLTSNKYPQKEGVDTIIKSLEILSEASPQEKIYVSCFFGKHRTGLIIGLYQFLSLYSANQQTACANVGTNKDKAYKQMNSIAAKGVLTYNMPKVFKEFYVDFATSVCRGQSYEFLESQGAKL